MDHMNNSFDVIIVGAGPSGCSCAHQLLDAGKKVLIMDKSTFPRHKPCAGGITMKTLRHLPFNIDHLVEHTARKMKFSFGGSKEISLSHDNGSCVMVIRDKFDAYFFEQTIKKGAVFEKIKKIKQITNTQKKNNYGSRWKDL
jgi:flavin-dependent dehydrogenase